MEEDAVEVGPVADVRGAELACGQAEIEVLLVRDLLDGRLLDCGEAVVVPYAL